LEASLEAVVFVSPPLPLLLLTLAPQEFLYSTTSPTLCIRVLNELPSSDGVTAVRLALHTLEALEGSPVATGAPFKTNPPFRFGLRNALNLLRNVPPAILASLSPFTSPVSAAEAAAPTSSAGLRAYYAAPQPALGQYRLYRSQPSVFKRLLAALDEWKANTGWRGFFVLLNFSPSAAAAIVASSAELQSIEARYRGVFIPVGQPPGGKPWAADEPPPRGRVLLEQLRQTHDGVQFQAHRLPLGLGRHVGACGGRGLHLHQRRAAGLDQVDGGGAPGGGARV
jgi:hypothetical protein